MSLEKHKIRGISIWLNPKDKGISHRLIATNGARELCFDWIMRHEARGTAFDVGANIGWCSLQLSKTCTTVFAFEPDPRNLRLLEYNAMLKQNIAVIPKAIVAHKGETMMSFAEKPNLNTVCILNATPIKCNSIDCLTLTPAFIKSDIEGSETLLIQGGMKTFKAAKQMKLLFEVHPERYNKENNFRIELEKLLETGFKFKYVVNAKGKKYMLEKYKCIKKFHGFSRAVWSGVPIDKCLKWATEMPEDGKKVLRSILLEKA